MIELRTLGALGLSSSEGTPLASVLAQPRRTALLCYLALESPRGFQRRDTLYALFWPEHSTEQARHALRQSLYFLRHELGPEAIVSRGDDAVAVEHDRVHCDAVELERAADEGRVEEALALYRGDLLEGFHITGAPDFERWLEGERSRLRGRAAELAWSLTEARERAGDPRGAAKWGRYAAGLSPTDETELRRLVLLLDRLGDRAAALRAYEAFALSLQREYELELSEETRALAERIRAGDQTRPPRASGVALGDEPRIRTATAFRDALVGAPGSPDRPEEAGGPTGRRITRRRIVMAMAAVAVLTLVVVPRITRQRGGGPPAAAPAVPGVAVLPFRTVGADPELWHEGIVDLLSYNLEGIGQLRKIDPVTVLTGWRRMGGSASNALSADEAREVGRRLGSRYVVTGRAVQIGADVQLIAEVQDVESGKMRGAVRVTGPTDSASSLVDELTLELLRGNLLPTDGEYPPPSLSRATTSSLPALNAYLAGERDYRTAQWSDAVRHYHRAIEADSNFASAWFRLNGACSWGGCPFKLGEAYGRRALALADQLPDRDAKLIRATSTNDVEALEALTAAYPDDVEAWIALGDTYYHHGGVTLRSTDAYRGALTRAVRLHPYYGEPFVHLIEDAFLRLDSLDAQRLINGYVATAGHRACSYQLSYDLVWGTAAARERAMAVLDTVAPNCLVQAPLAALPQALDRIAQISDALADTSTDADNRVDALWRLLQVRVPTGQITAARRTLARMDGVPVTGNRAARWEIQLHLSGFADSAAARRAARVIAAEGAPTDHFWVGVLAIAEGRWRDVEIVRRALERQTQSVEADGGPPGANARAYAAALGAYAGLVRGDRSRLADFESALARLPAFNWHSEQPQKYLRYRVGKLLFDDGRPRDAERYFRSFNAYDYFYTSPAELYLGRIAEAGGRPEEAVTHYGRVVRWWRYADAPLRPQWEEARQALSRLAGE